MTQTITIGSGISIGGGVSMGTTQSFTLSSSDFTNAYAGNGATPNGNTGFTTAGLYGPGEELYGPQLGLNYGGNPAKLTEVLNFWTSNGLTANGPAYMFNVVWGAGSTLSSGVVIMGLYNTYDPVNYTNNLNMGVVDTSNPVWQTSGTGYYDGPIYTLAGTWNLPATFTLIQPLITDGQEWC